jgi:hypothetical protein
MTPAESITLLRHFGYSEREAKFLYLVATHSGVFLQSQYQALGVCRTSGYKLACKALRNKDVRAHLPERGQTKVYELCGLSIYGGLGKEKLSACKPGPDLMARAAVKLLTLDFVLTHLAGHYLEKETEKVSYFVEEQHVNKEILPSRLFRGEVGGESCCRYFSERFPIFLSTGSDERLINFAYIEDETLSLNAFSKFVRRYRPLFCALGGNFRLIFVSRSTRSFYFARQIFVKQLSAVNKGAQTKQLTRFFWLRKMAEEKRFKELADQDVIDWQRGMKRYGDPHHEGQYQDWKQTGNLPEPELGEDGPVVPDPVGQFETFLSLPSFD